MPNTGIYDGIKDPLERHENFKKAPLAYESRLWTDTYIGIMKKAF